MKHYSIVDVLKNVFSGIIEAINELFCFNLYFITQVIILYLFQINHVMKKILPLVALFIYFQCNSQSVGIGTTTPNPQAILDVTVPNPNTTPQGLLLPRLNGTQKATLTTSLSTAHAGMVVFDSTLGRVDTWNGTDWDSNSGSGTGVWSQIGLDIHYTTGNVGIGTNAPSFDLDVVGSINTDTVIADVIQIPTNAGDGYHMVSGPNGETLWEANYGFHVECLTGGQDFNSGIFTPLNFDNILFEDGGNNFDLTNDEYVVAATGQYFLQGNFGTEGVNGTIDLILSIFVNGTPVKTNVSISTGAPSSKSSNISCILPLNVGDKVSIRLNHDRPAGLQSRISESQQYIWFNGYKLY